MKGCQDLTPRQLEVLAHYASGKTASQIANHIYLSIPTVRNYLKAAKKVSGAKTLTQTVAWCISTHKLQVMPDGSYIIPEA